MRNRYYEFCSRFDGVNPSLRFVVLEQLGGRLCEISCNGALCFSEQTACDGGSVLGAVF